MKVIPVIDVLNGIVVHAVQGKRKEYQPLTSVLTKSVDPLIVAQTFRTLGFKKIYLADLDAILGKQPSYALYNNIAKKTGLELIVDVGVKDLTTVEKMLNSQVTRIIIGTETIPNQEFIQKSIEKFTAGKLILSLDLIGDKILSQNKAVLSKNPLNLLQENKEIGIQEFIILDLSRVGSKEGPNINFLKKAQTVLQNNISVGGGVRDMADLIELERLGISGVLVATALHSGNISIDDLTKVAMI